MVIFQSENNKIPTRKFIAKILKIPLLGRGALAVFVSLRRTPPVDYVFCVVSSIFEVADFKFRCSQVPIPAVFSQFARQNYFNTTASTPFLIDIDTGSTAYLSILYYRTKHMLYTDYE